MTMMCLFFLSKTLRVKSSVVWCFARLSFCNFLFFVCLFALSSLFLCFCFLLRTTVDVFKDTKILGDYSTRSFNKSKKYFIILQGQVWVILRHLLVAKFYSLWLHYFHFSLEESPNLQSKIRSSLKSARTRCIATKSPFLREQTK